MFRDVGIAVPKTTETRCRDRAYKHCTNNPIPTPFFRTMSFQVISEHNQRKMSLTKKDVEMGLFVQCLYALSLHLVSVVFGTAIPTSLNIFGVIFTCFCHCLHHMGGCCSSSLPSGTNKQTCEHRQLLLCVMDWEYIARRS